MAEEASVALRPAGALWEAGFWPARARAGGARIAEILGGEAPAPGASLVAGGARLWRAGPVTWRLLGAAGAPPEALAWIGSGDGALTELGPGWSLIEVRGPRAAALMARAVTLDLREPAFPPGAVAATGHRHVAVTVIRPERGGYDMLAPRSYAESFAEALSRQAARLG